MLVLVLCATWGCSSNPRADADAYEAADGEVYDASDADNAIDVADQVDGEVYDASDADDAEVDTDTGPLGCSDALVPKQAKVSTI